MDALIFLLGGRLGVTLVLGRVVVTIGQVVQHPSASILTSAPGLNSTSRSCILLAIRILPLGKNTSLDETENDRTSSVSSERKGTNFLL